MVSSEARQSAESALEFFLKAVGYPERPPAGAVSFVLNVDGMERRAEEMDGRIVLAYTLTADGAILSRLAEFAAGRMLKEESTLSWENGNAFLWQDAPTDADARVLLRLFESFMDSCDWWRERVGALSGNEAFSESAPETLMIRP